MEHQLSMPGLDEDKVREEDATIRKAAGIIRERLREVGTRPTIGCPEDAAQLLRLKLATREREVFAMLLLDAQHRLMEYREIFSGTLDHAVVYPREIVRLALLRNAHTIVVAHNHPSLDPTPSKADIETTRQIIAGLEIVGIHFLDHLIIGRETFSMARKGILGETEAPTVAVTTTPSDANAKPAKTQRAPSRHFAWPLLHRRPA